MRLKNMYFLCKKWIEQYSAFKFDPMATSSHEPRFTLRNWDHFKSDALALEIIPGMSEKVHKIISIGEPRWTAKGLMLSEFVAKEMREALAELNNSIDTIIKLCDGLGYETLQKDQSGFDVKLPPNIGLTDMMKCMREVDSAISQYPYLTQTGANVQFKTMDVGSTWMTFFIVGSCAFAALGSIAYLVDKCIILCSHKATLDQQKEVLKSMELKNQTAESVSEIHKAILEGLKEQLVDQLVPQCGDMSPEEREQTKYSMDIISDWMRLGLEILPAIETPSDVKAAFPTVEQHRISDGVQKLLLDNANASIDA